MPEPLLLACDEAGFTGPDLLNIDQRHFGYASITMGDDEAQAIIGELRDTYKVQMPELKASKLLQSARGRRLIGDLISRIEGRYAVNVHEKLLALCGWIFEYIYEPVFKNDPRILYHKNLHRFVAMFAWLWFEENEGGAAEAIRQFQAYMRSRNENDAPILFNGIDQPIDREGAHPFELVLRFAHGYRDRILADNRNLAKVLPEGGKWVLELTISALWSHLNHWGRDKRPLKVHCDVSKPLRDSADAFIGDETDPAIARARAMGFTEPMGWMFAEPLNFVASCDHPAIQIADMLAGTAVYCAGRGVPSGFDETATALYRHMLPDSIMPDFSVVNPSERAAAVNYLVLFELASRAEKNADPYENLSAFYHAAEVSWARGDFDRLMPGS